MREVWNVAAWGWASMPPNALDALAAAATPPTNGTTNAPTSSIARNTPADSRNSRGLAAVGRAALSRWRRSTMVLFVPGAIGRHLPDAQGVPFSLRWHAACSLLMQRRRQERSRDHDTLTILVQWHHA